MFTDPKDLVEELKGEWKKLWRDRIDDKDRAEGIANDEYSSLFIDRGTIIHATRDFRVLNFKDILEEYKIEKAERYLSPDPRIGGWTKFVKDHQTRSKLEHIQQQRIVIERKEKKQLKKCGRGWLHI